MKLRSAVALVVAILALSACGAESSSDVVSATTEPAQSSVTQPASNVDNFVAKTVSGETFVLSNALAQKPAVLWFWAPG